GSFPLSSAFYLPGRACNLMATGRAPRAPFPPRALWQGACQAHDGDGPEGRGPAIYPEGVPDFPTVGNGLCRNTPGAAHWARAEQGKQGSQAEVDRTNVAVRSRTAGPRGAGAARCRPARRWTSSRPSRGSSCEASPGASPRG